MGAEHMSRRVFVKGALAGAAGISVPCGFTAERLPIGLQISGRPGAEATVLQLAHAYERTTGRNVRNFYQCNQLCEFSRRLDVTFAAPPWRGRQAGFHGGTRNEVFGIDAVDTEQRPAHDLYIRLRYYDCHVGITFLAGRRFHRHPADSTPSRSASTWARRWSDSGRTRRCDRLIAYRRVLEEV